MTLSTDDGCFINWKVQHELLHALGFDHEQSRPIRDENVKINYENIVRGMEYNFEKSSALTIGSPYDYGSVLHFGKHFLSKKGDTITAPEGICEKIGQRVKASEEDIQQVILLIECVSQCSSVA